MADATTSGSPLQEIEKVIVATDILAMHASLRLRHTEVTSQYLTDLTRSVLNLKDPIFDLFDEAYYLITNRDVLDHMFAGGIDCGLRHFLGWGIYEGRAPIREIDRHHLSDYLLKGQPLQSRVGAKSVLSFDELCDRLPFIASSHLAKIFVREPVAVAADTKNRLGRPLARLYPSRPWLEQVMEEFDPKFYTTITQLTFPTKLDAFQHYITACAVSTPNPNADFDEAFYRAFHYDINAAIKRGELVSGFEHYVISGRKEGRLKTFDAVSTLEAIIPSITKPIAIESLDDLERKVIPCPHEVDSTRPPTVWLILPFLHTDLMFGGFTSFVEFIERLLKRSVRVGLFVKDAPVGTLAYYKYRSPNRMLAKYLDKLETYSPIDSGRDFTFSPDDMFICYSNWDGLWAQKFAAKTKFGKPVFWVQEHEAIFFSYDPRRFLMDSVYLKDHIAIFNSEFLRQYFKRQKIGLHQRAGFTESQSVAYEHVLQFAPPSIHSSDEVSIRKRFLLYARPESHATRNLFEISLIALRQAVREGVFDDTWEFKGVGSLGGPYEVEIANGKSLEIVPKMSLDEYKKFIQGVDVGMSLMYAPHPSLLPYEIALTGAVVITNNFEERGAEFFAKYEGNIVSFDLSVDDCVESIRQAVARVTKPGYRKHRPKYAPRTWDDVFGDAFFEALKRIGVLFDAYRSR